MTVQARAITRYGADESGAIAPMYALALFGLIAIAGVGWDYSRLMAMDSELQNAADQAALAAASQLDGTSTAMARARAAAQDYLASADSEWVNETRLANDGVGRPIEGLTFRFYEGYNRATDTFGAEVEDDADAEDAKVVSVTVNGRESFYALTAVVGTLSSGPIEANAVAGLDTAVCRVPPLMVCIAEPDFPQPSDRGRGIVMRSLPNNNVSPLAPGNFGFLDIYGTHPGTGNPNRELGENADFDGCGGTTGIGTEPGFRGSETNALNTRFDIYSNPLSCDPTSGDFCPAQSVRKNMSVTETVSIRVPATAPVPTASCGMPDSTRATQGGSIDWVDNPAAANFGRDTCFGAGTCSYIGDGQWDRATYYATHHPTASYDSDVTRYETYLWELDEPSTRLAPRMLSSTYTTQNQGANRRYNFTNICAYPQPLTGTPLEPSSAQKDRRVLTVAAVDCTGLAGRDPVTVIRWIDLFIVGPAAKNGPDELGEVFVEVIGPAERPGGGSAFQFYGRNKPVLLR